MTTIDLDHNLNQDLDHDPVTIVPPTPSAAIPYLAVRDGRARDRLVRRRSRRAPARRTHHDAGRPRRPCRARVRRCRGDVPRGGVPRDRPCRAEPGRGVRQPRPRRCRRRPDGRSRRARGRRDDERGRRGLRAPRRDDRRPVRPPVDAADAPPGRARRGHRGGRRHRGGVPARRHRVHLAVGTRRRPRRDLLLRGARLDVRRRAGRRPRVAGARGHAGPGDLRRPRTSHAVRVLRGRRRRQPRSPVSATPAARPASRLPNRTGASPTAPTTRARRSPSSSCRKPPHSAQARPGRDARAQRPARGRPHVHDVRGARLRTRPAPFTSACSVGSSLPVASTTGGACSRSRR